MHPKQNCYRYVCRGGSIPHHEHPQRVLYQQEHQTGLRPPSRPAPPLLPRDLQYPPGGQCKSARLLASAELASFSATNRGRGRGETSKGRRQTTWCPRCHQHHLQSGNSATATAYRKLKTFPIIGTLYHSIPSHFFYACS